MNQQGTVNALALIEQLKNDREMSRRFKERAERIVLILQENSAVGLEKAILELEGLDTMETSSYCRTQIWDLISLLESMKN